MQFKFSCPSCQTERMADRKIVGRRVRCPECGHVSRVTPDAVDPDFDPYYHWLAIAKDEQPPNYYKLLGVRIFEDNDDIIANSSDRQMLHIKAQSSGRYAQISQRLLNELSKARACLLNPKRRREYDARLRLTSGASGPVPSPVSVPDSAPSAAPVPTSSPTASNQDEGATIAPGPSSRIVVTAGPDKGLTFQLFEGRRLVLGRDTTCNARLSDQSVSRVHCEVETKAGRAQVIDCGSSYGTAVNGVAADEHELTDGDVICIGTSEIRFVVGDKRLAELSKDLFQPAEHEGSQVQDEPELMLAEDVQTEPEDAKDELKLDEDDSSDAASDELFGSTIGRYELESLFHSGGSSKIYRSYDHQHDCPVVVKVFTPELISTDQWRQRIFRSAVTLQGIEDEHLVKVTDVGMTDAYCWMAMEFVDGANLATVMKVEGMVGKGVYVDWSEAFRVAGNIAKSLCVLHSRNIIHRNISPRHIIRRKNKQRYVLCDLILAKSLSDPLSKKITQPSEVVGELPYLAPEQTLSSENTDCRSDLYGLGATLYSLLTGHPPFRSESAPELIDMIHNDRPERPTDIHQDIHPRFEEVVLKLLAKRPKDRFQSAENLLERLAIVGAAAGMDGEIGL